VVRRRSEFRRTKAQDRLHLVEGLLVAILDIDEVIQLIRSSDNAEQARGRLMQVFDLTEVQANYILDMPLRRLTKFSRIELEKEQSQLQRTIEELTAILDDEALLRKVVSDELAEIAKQHGTPRRTVLLESAGTSVAAAASSLPLEVSDDPCFVLMSSAGLLARTTDQEPLGEGGGRAKHDVVVSAVPATARGQVAALTSRGRLIRLDVLDLPTLPSTANAPHLQGGAPISEFLVLAPEERVLCLSTLDPDSVGLALGTAAGVVKRVAPDHPANKDAWDVVRLDESDEVVGGVELRTGDEELVFVSTSAQLLRFPASAVRPQGRSGGGVAGLRLSDGARVRFFGAIDAGGDAVVVTVSGSSDSLPGTEAGSLKATPFDEYPAKGRATGGVRCHRFLRGEDALLVAWAGPAPARAAATSGAPVDLPAAEGRRDGSGSPAPQPIAAVAGPAAALTPPA
jgi:DNA gyrase subunit A